MPRTLALTCTLAAGLFGAVLFTPSAYADDPVEETNSNQICVWGWTSGSTIGGYQTGQFCTWGWPDATYCDGGSGDGATYTVKQGINGSDYVYVRTCTPGFVP